MRQLPTNAESWNEVDGALLSRGRPVARRDTREAALTRTVETEVIPRLLMARRPQRLARAVSEAERLTGQPVGREQVDHLTAAVLHGGQSEAIAYVEAMRDGGTPTETLLLDLLTPTARQLGQMWEDDCCTFSDVTLGLIRLGNVMRLLSRSVDAEYEPRRAGPSALLLQVPGEQHGFGLAMVVQFFRRAGWNVRQEPVASYAELVGLVRQNWFGIIGISVACSLRLEALSDGIRAIRRHSRNRTIGVMVGGPPFVADPELAAMIGADATATDGRHAVRQAERLISLRAGVQ